MTNCNFLPHIWNLRPKSSKFAKIIVWIFAPCWTLVTFRFGQNCDYYEFYAASLPARHLSGVIKEKYILSILSNCLTDWIQKSIPYLQFKIYYNQILQVKLLPFEVDRQSRLGAPCLTRSYFHTIFKIYDQNDTSQRTRCTF